MLNKTSQISPTLIALVAQVALLVGLTAACGRDDYYIVFERTELRGPERISSGGGCVLVLQRGGAFGGGSVSGSGGSADGDLSIAEGSQGEGYEVVVSSQGKELARRNYGREFLLSHDVDIFEVTTQAGKRFEFLYRGSPECDLPEVEVAADERT